MRKENLPQSVIDFLNYMETIKGASKNTIYAYKIDLNLLFRFLVHKKNRIEYSDDMDIKDLGSKFINQITLSDLYSFMTFLEKERNNGTYARSRKVASIKSYFEYLQLKAKIIKENVSLELEKPKIEKRNPIYLSLDQSKKLLGSMDEKDDNYKRDYAILVVFLNTGLRISELRMIKIDKIRDNILTVIGKGNKERDVPLNNLCLKAISDYMTIRDDSKCMIENKGYLFLSRNHRPISKTMIELVVKKYVENAGLSGNKFTPHKLRHTASTLMYKYGKVDIVALQGILGHESIKTTQIYTHCDDQQLQNAVNSNPLNNL